MELCSTDSGPIFIKEVLINSQDITGLFQEKIQRQQYYHFQFTPEYIHSLLPSFTVQSDDLLLIHYG